MRRGHRGRNVVGLHGGLGNQLFQVAFALWLERSTPYRSVLDLSAFRRRPGYLGLVEIGMARLPVTRRSRLLPYPTGERARAGVIGRMLLGPARIVMATHPSQEVTPHAAERPAWWYGYWQNLAQVDAVLPRLRALLPAAQGGFSDEIGMHVRRGDVDAASALDADYYPRALARLRAAHPQAGALRVAVYSDDPEWCERHLGIDARYVPQGTAGADLRALAACRFLVLSGSTFSWWAAHLQPRDPGTVVAPLPFSGISGQQLERDGWLLEPR